jgi:hypothetical protein
VKGPAVVSTAAQLLELNYYDSFPAICNLLKELVAKHAALLEFHLAEIVGALLSTYNTLPVVDSTELVKHVESTLDMMAFQLDAHAMMQVCPWMNLPKNGTEVTVDDVGCNW